MAVITISIFGRYPLSLYLREDNFFAKRKTGGVIVSCYYKRSSCWGILTWPRYYEPYKRSGCPIWLLEIEFKIKQTSGRINYAAFSLEFDSEMTEFYKPSIRQETAAQPEITTLAEVVKVRHLIHETKETITDRWLLATIRSSSTLKESKSGIRKIWTFQPRPRDLATRRITLIRMEPEIELNKDAIIPLTTLIDQAFNQAQDALRELSSPDLETQTTAIAAIPFTFSALTTHPAAPSTMLPAPQPSSLLVNEPSILPVYGPMAVPPLPIVPSTQPMASLHT
ncbi:uncharacterized protein B0T15DRAFT_558648 [Chaetomium strumarium]|uniref:Uncharacterized protein n=1 Tax=Chaetomium strumarium TaxID=1170767 RepID=A0AAJ0M0S9_9PEZI|nr:hypothetical protein B0T15DRAFT_558648 [Chaetomium strumarium]